MEKYCEICNAEVPGKVRQDNDEFKKGVYMYTHIIKYRLAGSFEIVATVPAYLLCISSLLELSEAASGLAAKFPL